MMLKDNNFISAVVYLHNDGARAVEFCRTVAAELDANFKQYELVVVDDACTDDTVKQLRAWGREQDAPLTILHMSIYHGLEDAMNAGLDAAIGDYVYEFDSTELCYAPTLIMQAYRAALDGNDIVSVCPRTVRGGSSLFYKVFNAHSQSAYRLRTPFTITAVISCWTPVQSWQKAAPPMKAALHGLLWTFPSAQKLIQIPATVANTRLLR